MMNLFFHVGGWFQCLQSKRYHINIKLSKNLLFHVLFSTYVRRMLEHRAKPHSWTSNSAASLTSGKHRASSSCLVSISTVGWKAEAADPSNLSCSFPVARRASKAAAFVPRGFRLKHFTIKLNVV